MNCDRTRRKFLKELGAASVIGLALRRKIFAATAKRTLPAVPLDFIPEELTVNKRSAWTGVKPKTWLLRESGKFDRITVHHTGYRSHSRTHRNAVIHSLSGILKGHLDREYGDIGYHILIDRMGRVWEGRSLAYEGAHVLDQNERNIGIAFLGNFEKEKVPEKQAKTLEVLVKAFCDHYEIKNHRIYGHRDLSHSICPGKNMYSHVLDLRKNSHKKQDSSQAFSPREDF